MRWIKYVCEHVIGCLLCLYHRYMRIGFLNLNVGNVAIKLYSCTGYSLKSVYILWAWGLWTEPNETLFRIEEKRIFFFFHFTYRYLRRYSWNFLYSFRTGVIMILHNSQTFVSLVTFCLFAIISNYSSVKQLDNIVRWKQRVAY